MVFKMNTRKSEGEHDYGKLRTPHRAMNAMYRLPAHEKPTLPPDTADRLRRFKTTLLDEVHEIDDIIAATEAGALPW